MAATDSTGLRRSDRRVEDRTGEVIVDPTGYTFLDTNGLGALDG